MTKPFALQNEGASCWFKVSRLSVDSLKLAVRTPETRVSLEDPAIEARPTLKEISWVGGFLDGVTIPLSTDLTTLIGGRGLENRPPMRASDSCWGSPRLVQRRNETMTAS